MKYFAALGIAVLLIAASSVGPWAPSPFTSQTGTNTTAAAWRTALGAASTSVLSGYVTNNGGLATNLGVSSLTNFDLTASRVPYSDSNKKLTSSAVTATELGYLSGVSGGIQTNLDARLPLSGGTMSGQLNFSGTNHAGIKLVSLTTTQRDALTPANGMLIYNSTAGAIQQYASGAWATVASGSFSLYAENPIAQVTPIASGTNAVAIGNGTTATADNSFSAGSGSTATAQYATAIGFDVDATAKGATAIGYEGAAEAAYSLSIGLCRTVNVGQSALLFAGNGVVSSTRAIAQQGLAAQTTDATQTEMLFVFDGLTSRVALQNNSTISFSARIVARRTDADGENDAWEFKGLIHRDANAASTTLDALQENHIGLTAWSVDVDADTTNGSLRVRVTGENAKTLRWIAAIETTEVSE